MPAKTAGWRTCCSHARPFCKSCACLPGSGLDFFIIANLHHGTGHSGPKARMAWHRFHPQPPLRGYAMEKAGSTQGWTFTIFEEAFNQGYPQELRHFVECVREDKPPIVTAEDGRAVLEIMYAAYQSARTGQKVPLPFSPKVKKPIDLWLG